MPTAGPRNISLNLPTPGKTFFLHLYECHPKIYGKIGEQILVAVVLLIKKKQLLALFMQLNAWRKLLLNVVNFRRLIV